MKHQGEIVKLIAEAIDDIGEGCSKDNWDSYDAPALKPKVVDEARRIFSDMFICPVADGSIALSFDDERIIIEVKENGSVGVILLDEKIRVSRA